MLVLAVSLAKNRRFHAGDVFVASRLSRGNRLFPTQVAVTPTSVIQFKPQWLGRQEHSIHISHVASVSIDTGLLLSDVIIETSGGSEPIRCHGHRKGDATRMKQLVEQYQTQRAVGAGDGRSRRRTAERPATAPSARRRSRPRRRSAATAAATCPSAYAL